MNSQSHFGATTPTVVSIENQKLMISQNFPKIWCYCDMSGELPCHLVFFGKFCDIINFWESIETTVGVVVPSNTH